MINPIDAEALRERIRSSRPYPHCMIDNFLDQSFADQVYEAFPTFHEALSIGLKFRTVNERNKVQITDSSRFLGPVAELNRLLADIAFIKTLSYVFDIPDLLADEELTGGGIHQTG